MSTIVQVQYHYRTGLNCWKGLVMFIVIIIIIISFHFYTFSRHPSQFLCFSLSLKKANWNGLSLAVTYKWMAQISNICLLSYVSLNLPAYQIYVLPGSSFAQHFILFYSPNSWNSNTHGFVLRGAAFIELFSIYYASTSEPWFKPSKLPVLALEQY